jgi:hypothetical protein
VRASRLTSPIRRTVAVLLCTLAAGGPAIDAAGCGAGAHLVGGVLAHHALNHLIGRRHANQLFCLYHGHRVLVDIRNHHPFIAGLNAIEAYRACKAGFFHRR